MRTGTRPYCPVCGVDTNTYGQPLASEWAVVSHVAGKIRSGDRSHRAWAELHAPGADYSGYSVPALANQLLPTVEAQLKAAREAAVRAMPSPLDLLHELEVALHRHVRRRLEEAYGLDEDGWWAQGVPLLIRQECVKRREGDPARDEPFSYTYLIDLKVIIEKNWALFEGDLRQVHTAAGAVSRKDFLQNLLVANDTRNRYAHPVRAPQRGTAEFEQDLAVAQGALEIVRGLTTRCS